MILTSLLRKMIQNAEVKKVRVPVRAPGGNYLFITVFLPLTIYSPPVMPLSDVRLRPMSRPPSV